MQTDWQADGLNNIIKSRFAVRNDIFIVTLGVGFDLKTYSKHCFMDGPVRTSYPSPPPPRKNRTVLTSISWGKYDAEMWETYV